ncbi:MAG TPA: YqiA/YcfP family alpha/beta fold hydrolase [Burkholderiales bacterium]|nr:YqiA/YcfP family alpha/beta fold hydrolase [Burkholderiales bacterium]
MLVYLHGFNSSPRSHKAQVLQRYLVERGLGQEYACPTLPPLARDALRTIEPLLSNKPCFVGSSLGGYYATHLAEKQGLKAVLVNPAIDPHVGLRAFLGPQKNLHTGEPYELSEAHLRDWEALYVPRITPGRYLLIVETGDEVLDYRHSVERYAGAEQIVIPGGDHSLQSFPQHLERILEFSRAPSL